MKNIEEIIKTLKESRAKQFNDETKIQNFSEHKTIPYNQWPDHWKEIDYKAYPKMEQVLLPIPGKPSWKLDRALINRKSLRDFTQKNIETKDFSNMLFYSGGIKKFLFNKEDEKRFYPSAGARYPLEIYPFVFKVQGIKPAIYHYHIKSHSLEKLLGGSFYNTSMKQFDQPWIRKSSMLIVVSSIFDRTEDKYGNRALRHIYTEYGHLAQNISLIASELNLGACSIGGFIDEGLNKLLDFDKIDESVIGVIAIGTI